MRSRGRGEFCPNYILFPLTLFTPRLHTIRPYFSTGIVFPAVYSSGWLYIYMYTLYVYIILLLYGPFSKRFPREKPITLSPSHSHSLPLTVFLFLESLTRRGALLYNNMLHTRARDIRWFLRKNNTSPGLCLSRVLRVFLFLKSILSDRKLTSRKHDAL